MSGISVVWGRTLDTVFTTYLKRFAGLLGIGLGVPLVVEQATGFGII